MKKIKTKKNKILKFYTAKEVFKKSSKSEAFRDAYHEELVRLKLVQQIKKNRLENNLTQKALAGKAQMSQSVIARIESGTHSFSLGTLNRIAKVFNKEVELA
ncbi:MAG: XRE family transcriptional regulator [Parcubacteria group bacterium GW2011_GWF2_38_8]|nr:MAG: XRE family transcriptional regulator [Parcubacteria group bacterium GW2011_GWF2_38_8]